MFWFKTNKSPIAAHVKAKDKAVEKNKQAADRVTTVLVQNGFTMEIFAALTLKDTRKHGKAS